MVSDLNKILADRRIWRKKARIGGLAYPYSPASTEEKSEFLTIDIMLLSFSYKVNVTVEDDRQFTEACHGVGIWQNPNLGNITPFCKAIPGDGFSCSV